MKKLICAKDIEARHGKGDQVIFIDKDTIITPSAKDLADDYQMTFKQGISEEIKRLTDPTNITKEQLVGVLKKLLTEAGVASLAEEPFEYDKHGSGLKIIRGSTMTLSPLNEQDKGVRYQALLTEEESQFELGILELDHSSLYEKDTLEAVNYIIDGELQVTIDTTSYTASQGDIIFIPQHATIKWSTPSRATIFSGKLKVGG